jgi:hypothetical protein
MLPKEGRRSFESRGCSAIHRHTEEGNRQGQNSDRDAREGSDRLAEKIKIPAGVSGRLRMFPAAAGMARMTTLW